MEQVEAARVAIGKLRSILPFDMDHAPNDDSWAVV
jgi:hypothetical protein